MKTAPGKYERIGDQKGPLNLGGAEAKMKEDPTMVYVPHHHIAGQKKAVLEWIKENKPDSNVKDILSNSYSLETLENDDVRQAFEEEILSAQKAREKTRDLRDNQRTMNLDFLTIFINTYEKEQRTRPKAERDGSSQSKVVVSLKQKVKALMEEGKVLDVTNMKKDGKGSKKDVFDEHKKRLAQSEGVPFFHVVYTQSNKAAADGVRNFLRLYGGFDADKISSIVEHVKTGSDINIGVAKSPTRANLMSPTASRKKRGGKREVDSELLG